MGSTQTLPVNIFNLEGGKTILVRKRMKSFVPRARIELTTFRILYRMHQPLNRRVQVQFSPLAWKFPLSWASMVSSPSKLKMFTGNVCVLLTSVSSKLSFRSLAEKNKQKQTNKQTLFGNYLNAISRPGF